MRVEILQTNGSELRNIPILFNNYTNFQMGILSDSNVFLWNKLYFPNYQSTALAYITLDTLKGVLPEKLFLNEMVLLKNAIHFPRFRYNLTEEYFSDITINRYF